MSHELRLLGTADLLRRFWDEVRDLDPKLGPLLLQLALARARQSLTPLANDPISDK